MNLKQDFRLLALIQLFVALFMGIPTIIASCWQETAAFRSFLVTIVIICLFSFAVLCLCKDRRNEHMSPADGFLFVTLTWVLATAFGALPLVFSGTMDNYSDAYFEIMSGFTTTGASALTSIEDKARSILFWRSETNWLGGMGIVVLFVAFLPMLGVKGTMLFGSESAGPTKDKLTPKTGGTAGALWTIYLGISCIQIIVLMLGRLNWYDAVTITFSTMSAAGFCVKNSSIGTFQSPFVDVVCIIFMFLAGVNFSLYFKVLNGKSKSALHDGEFRAYSKIVLCFSFLIAVNLAVSGIYQGFFTSLRQAFFQVVSIITTTGFSTADYTQWPYFSQMLLLALFFIGGCAGSTGGGIKVVRVIALIELGRNTLHKRLHPSAVCKNRIGGEVADNDVMLGIAGFTGLYLATGLAGSILVTLSGADLITAFSASFQALGNIGIGFGAVGPAGNFSIFPGWCQWVFSFLMLAGRLELVTVYALFSRSFWRDQGAWQASRNEKRRLEKEKLFYQQHRQTQALEKIAHQDDET